MILITGALISVLTMAGGLELTLTLSVACILLYYGLTHLAVLKIPGNDPPYPKLVATVGLLGCISLGVAVLFLW